MDEQFTVETARQAAHENKLEEWIGEFLTKGSKPNTGLWDAVKKRKGLWIGPVEVPIGKCVRGGSEIHKDKVNAILASNPSAESLPPILVRWHRQKNNYMLLMITDGNHRHEVFTRLKHKTCWILLELGTEDKD